jgi:hypothetical protein
MPLSKNSQKKYQLAETIAKLFSQQVYATAIEP